MRLRGQGDAGRALHECGAERQSRWMRSAPARARASKTKTNHAFGTNIAIGFRRKCPLAKTGWRQHRGLREADEASGSGQAFTPPTIAVSIPPGLDAAATAASNATSDSRARRIDREVGPWRSKT